jgi:hypothetical protein
MLYASLHDRYMAEIGNHHDPSDPRLSVPLELAKQDIDIFQRDEMKQYFIKLPSGDRSTTLEITVMLLLFVTSIIPLAQGPTNKVLQVLMLSMQSVRYSRFRATKHWNFLLFYFHLVFLQ